jgi:hypothetical protein
MFSVSLVDAGCIKLLERGGGGGDRLSCTTVLSQSWSKRARAVESFRGVVARGAINTGSFGDSRFAKAIYHIMTMATCNRTWGGRDLRIGKG